MKQFLPFLFLLIAVSAQGQLLRGTVVNGETSLPLTAVIAMNLATGQETLTDTSGNFKLEVRQGDKINFSLAGYHSIDKFVGSGEMRVELLPLSVSLPAYTLHELTQFQKDSAEMAELYSKELKTKPIKPGYSSANGGGFTGLIGGPVQKISRSYKRNKKFKENYRKDMEQKYIDTRYKPEVVTPLTGLSGDTLIFFMNTYPMEYAFARAATDLELKAWIRNNYKEYRVSLPANTMLPEKKDISGKASK